MNVFNRNHLIANIDRHQQQAQQHSGKLNAKLSASQPHLPNLLAANVNTNSQNKLFQAGNNLSVTNTGSASCASSSQGTNSSRELQHFSHMCSSTSNKLANCKLNDVQLSTELVNQQHQQQHRHHPHSFHRHPQQQQQTQQSLQPSNTNHYSTHYSYSHLNTAGIRNLMMSLSWAQERLSFKAIVEGINAKRARPVSGEMGLANNSSSGAIQYPVLVKVVKGKVNLVNSNKINRPTTIQSLMPNPMGNQQASKLKVNHLMLYKNKKSLFILTQSLKFKDDKQVLFGPKLSIPINYDGWFEILSEDGKSVEPINDVKSLVNYTIAANRLNSKNSSGQSQQNNASTNQSGTNNTTATNNASNTNNKSNSVSFIVRENLIAYYISSSTFKIKNDKNLPNDFIFSSSKLHECKTTVIKAGDRLQLEGEIYIESSSSHIERQGHEHQRDGAMLGMDYLKMIKCLVERNRYDTKNSALSASNPHLTNLIEYVYLPNTLKGKFSPIARMENISGMHKLTDIAKKFRFPITVRLLFGKKPPQYFVSSSASHKSSKSVDKKGARKSKNSATRRSSKGLASSDSSSSSSSSLCDTRGASTTTMSSCSSSGSSFTSTSSSSSSSFSTKSSNNSNTCYSYASSSTACTTSNQFHPVLRLLKLYEEEHMYAYPIEHDNLSCMVRIPVNECKCQFLAAQEMKYLLDKSTAVRSIVSKCDKLYHDNSNQMTYLPKSYEQAIERNEYAKSGSLNDENGKLKKKTSSFLGRLNFSNRNSVETNIIDKSTSMKFGNEDSSKTKLKQPSAGEESQDDKEYDEIDGLYEYVRTGKLPGHLKNEDMYFDWDSQPPAKQKQSSASSKDKATNRKSDSVATVPSTPTTTTSVNTGSRSQSKATNPPQPTKTSFNQLSANAQSQSSSVRQAQLSSASKPIEPLSTPYDTQGSKNSYNKDPSTAPSTLQKNLDSVNESFDKIFQKSKIAAAVLNNASTKTDGDANAVTTNAVSANESAGALSRKNYTESGGNIGDKCAEASTGSMTMPSANRLSSGKEFRAGSAGGVHTLNNSATGGMYVGSAGALVLNSKKTLTSNDNEMSNAYEEIKNKILKNSIPSRYNTSVNPSKGGITASVTIVPENCVKETSAGGHKKENTSNSNTQTNRNSYDYSRRVVNKSWLDIKTQAELYDANYNYDDLYYNDDSYDAYFDCGFDNDQAKLNINKMKFSGNSLNNNNASSSQAGKYATKKTGQNFVTTVNGYTSGAGQVNHNQEPTATVMVNQLQQPNTTSATPTTSQSHQNSSLTKMEKTYMQFDQIKKIPRKYELDAAENEQSNQPISYTSPGDHDENGDMLTSGGAKYMYSRPNISNSYMNLSKKLKEIEKKKSSKPTDLNFSYKFLSSNKTLSGTNMISSTSENKLNMISPKSNGAINGLSYRVNQNDSCSMHQQQPQQQSLTTPYYNSHQNLNISNNNLNYVGSNSKYPSASNGGNESHYPSAKDRLMDHKNATTSILSNMKKISRNEDLIDNELKNFYSGSHGSHTHSYSYTTHMNSLQNKSGAQSSNAPSFTKIFSGYENDMGSSTTTTSNTNKSASTCPGAVTNERYTSLVSKKYGYAASPITSGSCLTGAAGGGSLTKALNGYNGQNFEKSCVYSSEKNLFQSVMQATSAYMPPPHLVSAHQRKSTNSTNSCLDNDISQHQNPESASAGHHNIYSHHQYLYSQQHMYHQPSSLTKKTTSNLDSLAKGYVSSKLSQLNRKFSFNNNYSDTLKDSAEALSPGN